MLGLMNRKIGLSIVIVTDTFWTAISNDIFGVAWFGVSRGIR